MKNGILVCLGSGKLKNIGDYVQSIAAMQFAGHDAVRVERESLDTYAGGPTRLVMNAWFMWNPERFPPSADILPLFVSFHVRPAIEAQFFTEATTAYLKAHEPIGCRSTDVVNMMRRHGIKAEFTSCITLTLGALYRHEHSDAPPVFVDPFFMRLPKRPSVTAICRLIFRQVPRIPLFLRKRCALKTLVAKFRIYDSWPYNRFFLTRLLHAMEFYWSYSAAFEDEVLLRADYMTHKVLRTDYPTEDSLFAGADRLLRIYSKAPFVVTSRLHCSLPCVAMGTPCWTILPSKHLQAGRFGGNVEYMNLIEKTPAGRLKPWSARKIGLSDAPPSKRDFLVQAENLVRRCREFLSADGAGTEGPREKEEEQ